MTDPASPAPLDLDALRKIAEAATPGPWQAVEAHWPHYTMIVISNEGKDYTGFGVSCVNLMSDNAEHNTTHIAAFDPPTVLRLIELAESGVPTAVVQELTADRNRPLEQIKVLTAERDALAAEYARGMADAREIVRKKIEPPDCDNAVYDSSCGTWECSHEIRGYDCLCADRVEQAKALIAAIDARISAFATINKETQP